MTSIKITNSLVSVCIPLYNASKYIEETITKVLRQTYQNIEVIVVDDHSTDNSYAIAKTFESQNVKVFKNPKKGGNSARNYAFEKSKGDFIKFMDADDYCSDNMIQAQVERMYKDGNENTLIFSPLKKFYENKTQDLLRSIDKDYLVPMELLVDIWNFKGFNCPHCYLLHRSLVLNAGEWNEKILKNQDAEFFARVLSVSNKVLSVPYEFAFWRQTTNGVSTKKSTEALSSFIDTLEIISKLLIKFENTKKMRDTCGEFIGSYVFGNYPNIKFLYPKVEKVLEEIKVKIIPPNRRALRLLTSCFGWKMALMISHRLNL